MDLFFVLSGFLITMLLLREEDRTGRICISDFYWRRLLRIVPPFFLMVGLVSSYWILVKGRWDYLELVPYYFLFLSNFLVEDIPLLSIAWSLSVEEQFYLFWPVVMAFVLTTSRRRGLVIGLLIALNVGTITWVAASGYQAAALGPVALHLPNATYAPLLIGALLALLLQKRRSFAVVDAILGRRGAAAVLLGAIVLALALLPDDLRGWPNLILHTLMAALVGALVVSEHTPLHRVLCVPVLVWIGKISYGIYLYHHIARHVVVEIAERLGVDARLPIFLGMAVLSVILAEVSFRTFEKVFRDLRNVPPIWSGRRRRTLGKDADARRPRQSDRDRDRDRVVPGGVAQAQGSQ